MPYTPDEILDPEIVNELLEVGDAEFLQDLFETYIEDAREKIQGITQAMESGDAENLGRLAHTFKGASGNIGAIELSKIAEKLQNMGYNAQLDGVEAVVNDLKELYKLVETTMQNKMQELS
ncbi:MAG: Hpt domain-containing protein [Phycisphaeraceae bacterium JB051]